MDESVSIPGKAAAIFRNRGCNFQFHILSIMLFKYEKKLCQLKYFEQNLVIRIFDPQYNLTKGQSNFNGDRRKDLSVSVP